MLLSKTGAPGPFKPNNIYNSSTKHCFAGETYSPSTDGTTRYDVAPVQARGRDKSSQSQLHSTLSPESEQAPTWNNSSVPPPAPTLDLRLGDGEMVDCFRHSSMTVIDNLVIVNTTRFYTELYALRGSVVGEISLSHHQLRNRSESLNESLECQVYSGGYKTKMYCCVVRVRVPTGFHVVADLTESSVSETCLYDDTFQTQYIRTRNTSSTGVFISSSNFVDILRVITTPRVWGDKNDKDRFVVNFFMVENPGLSVRYTSLSTGK